MRFYLLVLASSLSLVSHVTLADDSNPQATGTHTLKFFPLTAERMRPPSHSTTFSMLPHRGSASPSSSGLPSASAEQPSVSPSMPHQNLTRSQAQQLLSIYNGNH